MISPRKISTASEAPKEPAVGYVFTRNIPELLTKCDINILVSTYQAQRILLFNPRGERMNMLMRVFESPKGIAVSQQLQYLVLGCKREVLFFKNGGQLASEAAQALAPPFTFVPRRSYVTGDVAIHELGWHDEELVFLATRFSCLAKLNEHASFVPVWRPPFITEVSPDDRCHLNGLCFEHGKLRYVSALAKSNEPQGWREQKADGGVLLSYPDGEVVAHGLSMPHSPRLHRGKLYLLDSGAGELITIDPESGRRETVVTLPGFLRGLTFFQNIAFVGLCKARETNLFGGLPVTERAEELQCAVYLVDIDSGEILGFLQFTKGIEELFDIVLLPGASQFEILGFEEDTLDGVFLLE